MIRHEFELEHSSIARAFIIVPFAVGLQWLIGTGAHLYRVGNIRGSFEELKVLAVTVLMVGWCLVLPVVLVGPALGISRGTTTISIPLALIMMAGFRYLARTRQEKSVLKQQVAEPVIVFGAGPLAVHLIDQLLTDPDSPMHPVAALDDSDMNHYRYIRTVPVLGTLHDLARVANFHDAKVLLIAVLDMSVELHRRVLAAAEKAGLDVRVFPTLKRALLYTKSAASNTLRNVPVEELILRKQVETHVADIAGYVSGGRVLVTGAGGSIGSELCLQLSKFNPQELIMVDRDETGLQHTQLKVRGNGLLDTREVVLTDIRDATAILELFETRRPDLVFHAAALKHLPKLEQYPLEAWKTNVLGSRNVLEADKRVGVSTFVNISTDEANRRHLPRRYSHPVTAKLFQRNQVVSSSVLIRRELLEQQGGYREDLSQMEDYELILRLAAHTRVLVVAKTLVDYRIHSKQITRTGRLHDRFLTQITSAQRDLARQQGVGLIRRWVYSSAWLGAQYLAILGIRRRRYDR